MGHSWESWDPTIYLTTLHIRITFEQLSKQRHFFTMSMYPKTINIFDVSLSVSRVTLCCCSLFSCVYVHPIFGRAFIYFSHIVRNIVWRKGCWYIIISLLPACVFALFHLSQWIPTYGWFLLYCSNVCRLPFFGVLFLASLYI